MTECTATFETGVNAANISTGDTGSATAWDAVTLGNGTGVGIAKYSSDQAANGTLSGLLGGTSGTGKGYLTWSTALGTVTDHYGRLYLYLTANPAGQISIMQVGTSAGATRGARLDITLAGKLAGFDNPAAALFTTFTTSIALNQWVRIEWHIIHSATVGQAEIKLFNTASSTTPTETQTGTANKNTLANATGIQFGLGVAGAADGVGLYMDNIVAGATSYPGPFSVAPANTVAPAVTGTTALGDTLTSTTGTWTGTPTPTYTYQWQRDGSNIGGATAATRVIAALDQGTTLRCVVTATNTAGAVTANSNGVSVPAAAAAAGSGMNPGLLGYLYTHGRSGR